MFRFKICFLESVFQDSSEPRIHFKQYSQLTFVYAYALRV